MQVWILLKAMEEWIIIFLHQSKRNFTNVIPYILAYKLTSKQKDLSN